MSENALPQIHRKYEVTFLVFFLFPKRSPGKAELNFDNTAREYR